VGLGQARAASNPNHERVRNMIETDGNVARAPSQAQPSASLCAKPEQSQCWYGEALLKLRSTSCGREG
jgi:hypothetical protein